MGSHTFTLRLLGGASLEGPSGTVSGRVVQRRRLALLALLAVARGRGLSRDKILGYLWSESPDRRGRHLLSESIYVIRKELGEAAVRGAGDDLLLDPEIIQSDVAEFEDALRRGAADRASEIYRGPFLDGFFLPGALEFERWVERERGHFQQRAVEACWLAAHRAESMGALDRAVESARQAVMLTEGDEAAVRRLIGLLVRSGNRAAALEAYEELAHELRQEYDLEPSVETLRLVRWVRAWGETSKAPPTEPAQAAVTGTLSPLSELPIAISPFNVRGKIDLSESGDDLAELLRVALHGAGGVHVVEWTGGLGPRRTHASGPEDPNLARLQVHGTLVADRESFAVRVSVRDMAFGGVEVLKLGVTRPPSNLGSLVDELAIAILGGICTGPGARLAAVAAGATTSLPALKHWLRGERGFRSGSTVEAVASFQRSLAEDPVFPLAHYRLATTVALFPQRDREMARAAIRAALLHSDRLAERDRDLLRAFGSVVEGAADEAERTYARLVDLYPDDVEAWFGLANTLLFYNPLRGRPVEEAIDPYERAGTLDPSFTMGTVSIAYITAREGDLAALEFLCQLPLISDIGLHVRTSRAFIRGDEADQQRWLAALRRASDGVIAESIRYTVVLAHDLAGAARMARLLTEPTRSPDARSAGHALAAHMELAAGHVKAAEVELDRLAEFDPFTAIECEAFFSILPHIDHGAAEIRTLLQAVRAIDPAAVPSHPGACLAITIHDGLHKILGEYLLGLLRARLQDELSALTHADRLAMLGDDVDARALADDLAWSVRAWTHWWAGRSDKALQSAERARLQAWNEPLLYSPFHSRVLDRYLRGVLLEEAGRYQEAEGWYASIEEYAAHDAVLLAPALVGLGRVRAERGDTEGAGQALERVIRFLRDADFELGPLAKEAHVRKARLSGGSDGPQR